MEQGVQSLQGMPVATAALSASNCLRLRAWTMAFGRLSWRGRRCDAPTQSGWARCCCLLRRLISAREGRADGGTEARGTLLHVPTPSDPGAG